MVRWIAEISSNHNQNINRTIKLIKKAKEIGCDAVKFQMFNADKLYAPGFKKQIDKMKKWELPEIFLPEIESFCCDINMAFGCSIFDLESFDTVVSYVDWVKIGSYELLYTDLIKKVVKNKYPKKPWMISAGMESFYPKNYPCFPDSYMKNIRRADRFGIKYNNQAQAILYCNSNYPALPKYCNLHNITNLKNYFMLPIGWSDHTVEPRVIYKAIELGAEIIEFHFDLEDGQGFESEIGHCWKPSKIKEVIHNVKIGEEAYKKYDTNELETKKWRTDPSDGMRPLKEFREELK